MALNDSGGMAAPVRDNTGSGWGLTCSLTPVAVTDPSMFLHRQPDEQRDHVCFRMMLACAVLELGIKLVGLALSPDTTHQTKSTDILRAMRSAIVSSCIDRTVFISKLLFTGSIRLRSSPCSRESLALRGSLVEQGQAISFGVPYRVAIR